MRLYSAVVKDVYEGNKLTIIENHESYNKAHFIHDLRRNGYAVNPMKVKRADVFDYIMENTDCRPCDWRIRKVPTKG